MAKTSIILCAGAWHTKTHIEPVIPFFEHTGYRLVPKTLPGSGATSDLPFEDDVNAIEFTVLVELQSGYNVVLILHSISGPSGLMAVSNIAANAKDYSGKLSRVMLLGSFVDIDPITEVLTRNDFFMFDPENPKISYAQHGEKAFYNDISPEKATPFIEALTSLRFYSTPAKVTSDRWQTAAPLTYLLCEHDTCVPPEIGEKVAAEYGMQLVRIDAGHCVFTSQPEKFAKVVDGILRA